MSWFSEGADNAGESVLEAANRELMEEVGYGAGILTCWQS